MSGVFKGKILDFFTGRTLLSKKKHNEVIAAVNPLLNMEVTMGGGQTPSVNYSDTKVQIKIPRQQSSASSSNFHPFQLYEVPTNWKASADKNKTCYAVRSGHVELRPRWWSFLGGTTTFAGNNVWFYNDVAGGNLGDDVEDEAGAAFGQSGSYFALNDLGGVAEEVIGGTKYGAYFSFWLQVQDDTANTPPVVSIQCQRWSISGSGFSAFPLKPFPAPVSDTTLNLFKTQIYPIAILQLNYTGNGIPFIPADSGIGLLPPSIGAVAISQIQTTNFVNRFNDCCATMLGYFDPAHYRVYYPGDIVVYDNGVGDPASGTYIAQGVGQNGGAITVPQDNTSANFMFTGKIY